MLKLHDYEKYNVVILLYYVTQLATSYSHLASYVMHVYEIAN